eukprot:3820343-Pyramimonas_sp.AAC.1
MSGASFSVDVKGSTVDVKGCTESAHLRRFLLDVRDSSGVELNSDFSSGKRSYELNKGLKE